MKAVLYGGGYYEDNVDLHRELVRLSDTKKPRITFIPSASDYGMVDFPDFVQSFRKVGKCSFLYFPVDRPVTPRLMREALASEVIFLSGGNTYGFLRDLRRQKLITALRARAKNGTVMSGLSAGGILLTPSIQTASFPSWDRDENHVKLKKLDALGICNFDFFPHYSNSERYRKELSGYSKKSERTLIATPDGGGLVVDDDKMSLYGRCTRFHKGHVIKV